jgi:hypothetical protein|tara:strand:- start:630 stop:1202 length:573 start_codon:yes stop_codon:yes gene_type:complete
VSSLVSYKQRRRALLEKRFPREAVILLSGCIVIVLGIILAPAFFHYSPEEADIVVYRSKRCGCAGEWISRLRKEGYSVSVQQPMYVSVVRRKFGVPEKFNACHTSIAGQYFIEGHVPMDSVQQLLRTTPNIAGISMPDPEVMEYPGAQGEGRSEDVIAVSNNGEFTSFTDLTRYSDTDNQEVEGNDGRSR